MVYSTQTYLKYEVKTREEKGVTICKMREIKKKK